MLSYDLGEGMEQEIQRGLVIVFSLLGDVVDRFLDMIHDLMGMFCSFEHEVILLSFRIEHDISFFEYGIPEGVAPDLGSPDIVIIYIDHMARKYIPIDIYDSDIGHEPDIIVPIEYLVEQIRIEQYRIRFKIEKRHESIYGKRIVVVEKGRERESEEQGHDDTVYDEQRVPMAHENELLMVSEVFAEKNLVKIIHKR